MKGEIMTTGTYIIQVKLVGDLDSVVRVMTILRKCSLKININEIKSKFNDKYIDLEIQVKGNEDIINWISRKLLSVYEVCETKIVKQFENGELKLIAETKIVR